MASGPGPFRTALILKADRLYAEFLSLRALEVAPSARIIVSSTLEAAKRALTEEPIDLFVSGMGTSLEGDLLELLAQRAEARLDPCRALVVSASGDVRALSALRTLGIAGVFDARNEPPNNLIMALGAVAHGCRYWSASILDLIHRDKNGARALSRILTAFEQLVLAVIGDGCDDQAAAQILGVSPATICTVRRDLHRKLRVQHRGALVRTAAQYGFVRFTPNGVVRPGFALLAAAYRPKKTKHAKTAAGNGQKTQCGIPALAP